MAFLLLVLINSIGFQSEFSLTIFWHEQDLQEPEAVVNPDHGTVAPVRVQPRASGDGDPQEDQLAILKTFPFESREQRMTVVVKARKSSTMEVFIKGAPERVATLCKKETGLSQSFSNSCLCGVLYEVHILINVVMICQWSISNN